VLCPLHGLLFEKSLRANENLFWRGELPEKKNKSVINLATFSLKSKKYLLFFKKA